MTSDWKTPADLGLPYPAWRTGQDDLIREIDTPGIHVLDLPTGVGKSGIAVGLGELERRRGGIAFIVVGTHALQDQYERTFGSNPNVLIIKGKDEYDCELHKATTAANCEFVLLDRNPRNCRFYDVCEYFRLRDLAVSGKFIVVMTYTFYMGVRSSENWPRPTLVVFDEAHDAAQHATDFVSLDFKYDTFERFGAGIPMEESDVLPCVRRMQFEVKNRLRQYEWFDVSNTAPETLKKINRLRSMDKKIATFLAEYDATWITDLGYDRVTVSPIWATKIAERVLWGNLARVVFMSATIGDPIEFAFELGLADYKFVSRPSPFPKEAREVSLIPWAFMSGDGGKAFANNLEAFVKKFDAALDDLGGIQSGLKVLVHTVSYAQAAMIHGNSKYVFSMILAEREDEKDKLIAEFRRRRDFAILIGPCFGQGIDLPGDECRVNIIAKVPYPDMGDKKTRARVAERPSWLDHITSIRIVQAAGRGVRSDDDWCITWIVDAQAKSFFNRARFPEWFRESVVQK